MEELKNIKVVIRWGRNGRKYVWENPTKKKLAEVVKKYGVDQICDGCLWLLRQEGVKMENKKHYDTYIKLFKEAYKLGVTELFNEVYKLGYSQGYDDAIKRFEEQ